MEEDNIVRFPGTVDFEVQDFGEDLDIEPVLDALREQELEDLLVVGRKSDGDIYFATTSGDPQKILWDLERAKFLLMLNYHMS